MCKLPELNEYLEQTPEQRDKTTWEFMHDMKNTIGWHWKIGAGVIGLLVGASSMGMAVMDKVGTRRDARIADISAKVDSAAVLTAASVAKLAAANARDDRRYVSDSTWREEVLRRLERIEREGRSR